MQQVVVQWMATQSINHRYHRSQRHASPPSHHIIADVKWCLFEVFLEFWTLRCYEKHIIFWRKRAMEQGTVTNYIGWSIISHGERRLERARTLVGKDEREQACRWIHFYQEFICYRSGAARAKI